jgi:hypothetical protein
MNNKNLIKLAEIAGVNAQIFTDEISKGKSVMFLDDLDFWQYWQPHEDDAQALQVLEGWRSKCESRYYCLISPKMENPLMRKFDVSLTKGEFPYTFNCDGDDQKLTICQAVLKAEGGEE